MASCKVQNNTHTLTHMCIWHYPVSGITNNFLGSRWLGQFQFSSSVFHNSYSLSHRPRLLYMHCCPWWWHWEPWCLQYTGVSVPTQAIPLPMAYWLLFKEYDLLEIPIFFPELYLIIRSPLWCLSQYQASASVHGSSGAAGFMVPKSVIMGVVYILPSSVSAWDVALDLLITASMCWP